MKYFLDTEFMEGPQARTFLGFKVGETKPTIDLISIGIVAEDGREYYAVSKDFNLKEAWNRYQISEDESFGKDDIRNRVYWLRENVLRPIFHELLLRSVNDRVFIQNHFYSFCKEFSFDGLKVLINWYGKTNKDIAIEIQEFVYGFAIKGYDENETQKETTKFLISQFKDKPEFYAYFADYDWVVFCWLFGKMMDLPSGFPMYCKDLKQLFDQKEDWLRIPTNSRHIDLKQHTHYPKTDNSQVHNALYDAKWNKELFDFLNKL